MILCQRIVGRGLIALPFVSGELFITLIATSYPPDLRHAVIMVDCKASQSVFDPLNVDNQRTLTLASTISTRH